MQQAFQKKAGYHVWLDFFFPFICEKCSLPSLQNRKITLIFGGRIVNERLWRASLGLPPAIPKQSSYQWGSTERTLNLVWISLLRGFISKDVLNVHLSWPYCCMSDVKVKINVWGTRQGRRCKSENQVSSLLSKMLDPIYRNFMGAYICFIFDKGSISCRQEIKDLFKL